MCVSPTSMWETYRLLNASNIQSRRIFFHQEYVDRQLGRYHGVWILQTEREKRGTGPCHLHVNVAARKYPPMILMVHVNRDLLVILVYERSQSIDFFIASSQEIECGRGGRVDAVDAVFVDTWLTDHVKLPEYIPAFHAAHLVSAPSLTQLREEDLDVVMRDGQVVIPVAHRVRLLTAASQLTANETETTTTTTTADINSSLPSQTSPAPTTGTITTILETDVGRGKKKRSREAKQAEALERMAKQLDEVRASAILVTFPPSSTPPLPPLMERRAVAWGGPAGNGGLPPLSPTPIVRRPLGTSSTPPSSTSPSRPVGSPPTSSPPRFTEHRRATRTSPSSPRGAISPGTFAAASTSPPIVRMITEAEADSAAWLAWGPTHRSHATDLERHVRETLVTVRERPPNPPTPEDVVRWRREQRLLGGTWGCVRQCGEAVEGEVAQRLAEVRCIRG